MTANEFLAGIENYEKFDPVKGTVEGKTYVVVPTTTETGKIQTSLSMDISP